MELRCLSVRQPFASAILTGQKVEEYRSKLTRHRGPLAIHASKTLEPSAFGDYPNFRPDRVTLGAILGIVDVADCLEDVYDGFVWVLANPRWLSKPLPCKGRVGLFPVTIPDELLPQELLAQAATLRD